LAEIASTVPLSPSVTATLLILKLGSASSLLIVPVPVVAAIVTLLGALNITVKVSLASFVGSPLIGTVTIWLLWPGVKVSVLLVAT